MKTRILFLDDEASYLDHYKNLLGPKSAQWEFDFHTDPQEALAAITANPPTIVIADLKMPAMQGTEFLAKVEKIAIEAQLIIAADREDKELIDASAGSSFQFLPKPCTGPQLITEIQRCVAIDSWLGNEKVREIVSHMGTFPSLPPMYLKVVSALNSRNASAAQIGHAISGDLAITAKVLQVVNSSYYGCDEKISDITQAVSVLGIDTVKSLVLGIQVFGSMAKDADQKAITDQLWHHSMSVAVAAKRLMEYETGDEKLAEEAYTAGLLHDLGKLVMMNAIPEEFEKARDYARENRVSQWLAEQEIIGCTHAETGAYVLGRWGMPATVVEAVALHHQPVNSSGAAFSTLVATHAANALVWERHPGDEPHPDSKPVERFLAEIGRAASWEEWQDVVTGKRTDKPAKKSGLSLQRSEPDERPNQKPSAQAKPAPQTALSARDQSSATEPKQIKSSPAANAPAESSSDAKSGKGVYFAIAAAAIVLVAATLLFISRFKHSLEGPVADADIEFLSQPTATEPEPDHSEIDQTEIAASEADIPEPNEAPEPEAVEIAAAEPELDQAPTAVEPAPRPSLVQEHPIPQIPAETDRFPQISLNGIFYSPTNPAVSLNGKILREGDRISGAEIVSIEQKRVVLRHEGEERVFKLK